MLEQAKNYLSRVVPWNGREFIGLHYTIRRKDMKNAIWAGKPVANVTEAVNQLGWMLTQPDIKDIYISMATQKEVEHKVSKAGRKYKAAIRTRENAGHLKALFMDMDVKEGAYPTTLDAAKALAGFIGEYNLPKATAIVLSGTGGLHAYWTLEEALTVQEWQPLADAMCNAAQNYGLHFDSQVTVDCVRILRVPDTFNHKRGEPLPVQLKLCRDTDIPNEDMAAALLPWMVTRSQALSADVNDELTAGIEPHRGPPKNIHEVADVCPWIDHTIKTYGAENDQPLWFLSLRIATFCEDADQVAQDVSSGHPDYHPDEVAQEVERLRSGKEVGYPLCKTICGYGAPQCKSCDKLALSSNPLSLSDVVKPSTALTVSLRNTAIPDGYMMNALGWIFEEVVDENNNKKMGKLLIPFPISDPWTTKVGSKWHLQFTTIMGEGEHFVSVPIESLATKDGVARSFGANNLTLKVTEKVQDFMVAFLQKLQTARETVVRLEPYGWNFDDKGVFSGFTYAGKSYGANGEAPAPHPDPALFDIYRAKGDSIAAWQEAAKLITQQKRPALDTLLACAFAGPLTHFFGGDVSGVTVGAIGASGIGKSTTLKVAQAVWGHPKKAMMGLTDTQNSVFNKAGKIRHLPLFWDEIKTAEETRNFTSMIFQLTSGNEKSRSNRDGSIRERKSFDTILAYASNESMYDAVHRQTTGTTAGHMRMFEFTVPGIDSPDRHISKVVGQLETSYGHAGREYAAYLGENYAQVLDQVHDTRTKWAAILDTTSDERFWETACACIITGAHIANKIGLTEFDEKGLRKFLFEEFKRMRGQKQNATNDLTKSENVIAIFGEFLNEMRFDRSVVTNMVHVEKGRPKAGAIKVEGEGTSRLNRLKTIEVQFGRGNKILRFSDEAIGRWLQANGYGKQAFINTLVSQLGAVHSYARLASGTDYANPVTRSIWQISVAGTELEDMCEIFTEEVNAKGDADALPA
jgi:Domain of unknown function (DUF927)